MKKRKGSLLQRMMAVLLSAVLVAGMLSNAAPVTVLAQEPDGQQENTGGSGTEPAANDTKPEEKTETAPTEGTGSGEQEKPAPEGQEKPGTTEGGGETEKGDDLTGQEPGGGMEEKPQEPGGTEEEQTEPGDAAEEETEPGTVSGNDAKQEPVAAPQRVMMAAVAAPQAENIASGTDWVLDKDGKLTISSDAGMLGWIVNGKNNHSSEVTSAGILDGVTKILAVAFSGCSGMKSVTISENVTIIGEWAFDDCSSLTGITIPSKVGEIGAAAFVRCSSLTTVTMRCETPPTIGKDVFTDSSFVMNKIKGILVPKGKAQTYKEAWTDWAAYIADDTHTHNWSSEWKQNETYHWHECAVQDCPVTDDAKKDGYGEHTYDDDSDQECNVCGYIKTSTEEHEHNGVTFTAWDKTDSLPTDAGNYYLTEDVVLPGTWNVPDGTTSLCLNGKTISASNNFGKITIPASCTLNLYGCKNAGTISFSSTRSVQNEGTFNMDGGKLSGSVYNDGTFYMYDGKISLKVQAANGGVVNKGSFLMYGGEISGNRTSSKGGGVNAGSGTFTVGGSAVIAGNNPDNVWIGVDSLIEIDEENPLSGSARIGITTQTAPTAGNPVNITGENGADYSQYFQSDNPDYEIVNGENNVVQLAVKHTHEADTAWQQDADGHWHNCQNGCGEKLDYAVHTFEENKCNVCGYIKTSTEEHEHNGVTFTAWTKTDSLPDTAGNYYLTENVTLSETWNVPSGTTALCLNGKTISAEGNANNIKWLIYIRDTEDIENDRTWNLYDCAGGGQITGGSYGCVGNGTTFYMYGGKITGGIRYGVDNAGAFYMYGGEISGNGNGGTYCNQYGSTITVGGSAVIAGNNSKNVWVGVDSLIEIDGENPLSGSAKIGITTENAPTAGNPVNITGKNDADYSRYFQSDNPDYVIVNGENNVVQLAVKPHTHNLTRVDAKTATCTEDGNTAYYTCDGCDKWFSDEEGTQEITDKKNVVIPAAGHAFDTEWGYKAADGHAHSCKNCDAHDEIQEHTPGETATESTPQICTECGYIINPAIGHTCDPRLVEKKEPDCTTAGKEAYYHCEGCGKYYEDEAGTTLIADISAWGNIAALGHDWGEWTVTKPATATTPGEKERTCKRCDEKETETIPKTGGGNKPGGSGSGGNSGGGTSGGSDDNSGGNSGDNGGDNGGNQGSGNAAGGNQDSSGNGSGSSGGNDSAGGSTGNSGGTGAGTSGKPGAPGTGQPRVKQEKEGNIRKEVRVEGEDTLDATVETPLPELADIVLTKEEKQKAAGGTDVRIVLDVKDASAVVSTADKTLVEKSLNGPQAKGYTLGQYLDINLFKVVGDSRSAITETKGKVTVTIDVPDRLKNADGTKTRTFAVIRVHNGKAELLPDLDSNADTITIKTDRFSTYAVVYKDTAGRNGSVDRVSVEDGSKKSDSAPDGEPKTGDSTSIELSATLAMIAGFAYLLLYFADRERGMTEETKKELVSRLVGWAKQGGRLRTYLALAAIFVLLVYYHSIGRKTCAEWKEIYGK